MLECPGCQRKFSSVKFKSQGETQKDLTITVWCESCWSTQADEKTRQCLELEYPRIGERLGAAEAEASSWFGTNLVATSTAGTLLFAFWTSSLVQNSLSQATLTTFQGSNSTSTNPDSSSTTHSNTFAWTVFVVGLALSAFQMFAFWRHAFADYLVYYFSKQLVLFQRFLKGGYSAVRDQLGDKGPSDAELERVLFATPSKWKLMKLARSKVDLSDLRQTGPSLLHLLWNVTTSIAWVLAWAYHASTGTIGVRLGCGLTFLCFLPQLLACFVWILVIRKKPFTKITEGSFNLK